MCGVFFSAAAAAAAAMMQDKVTSDRKPTPGDGRGEFQVREKSGVATTRSFFFLLSSREERRDGMAASP